MSFYTSSIKCKEVEPVYHTDSRTEFRLSNGDMPMYLSSMRLCNVGFKMSAQSPMNKGSGALSVIKRIEILDGNVSLENFVNFNQYVAFREQNRSNDKNCSSANILSQNQMGFATKSNVVQAFGSEKNADTSDDSTAKAWFSLRDYMAFLAESNEVPTSIYKDLKIVIEYENDPAVLCPGSANTFSGVVRPFMVVDEVVNEDLKQQRTKLYQGVQYKPFESLTVFSPVIGADKDESFTLTGFNSKTIQRMLMVKQPTTTVSGAYGKLCSVNFLKPKANLFVNGSQLLPSDIDTLAKELSSVSESWGDCNIPYPYADLNDTSKVASSIDRVGWQSYVNFDVSQFSREMVLKLSRGYNANAYYSQGVNIILYAEVIKRVMVNADGSYNVMYV